MTENLKTLGSDQKMIAENVISKLKDDGDFDRLRLKIVRQLKQNEVLRNSIISAVKQSAALNHPGAEKKKPRQLCDAIHDEIREQAMNLISDGLWGIIRSEDGMKAEIKETVQSVYDKVVNPQQIAGDEPAYSLGQVPVRQGTELNEPVMVSEESNGTMSNGGPKDFSSFSLPKHTGTDSHDSQSESKKLSPVDSRLPEQGREAQRCNSPSKIREKDRSPAPASSSSGKRRRASHANDEDPEIPPGFGS